MVRKISSIVCIAASSTLVLAACYERMYVDEACQINRCADPANSCGGNPIWINNAPVYTTNQLANGRERAPIDFLCRIEWHTMDNEGKCTVRHTCDKWTGGFELTIPCRQIVS
jgi:hypothetical protein